MDFPAVVLALIAMVYSALSFRAQVGLATLCDSLGYDWPSMKTTPQREHWDGNPVELGDAWTLRKGDKLARCILVSHKLGWELRVMTSDLLRSQVCRASDEVLSTDETWKIAILAKGWS